MSVNSNSDPLFKEFVGYLFKPSGRPETEFEVLTAAKRVDLWFTPDSLQATPRTELGVVNRMIDRPCIWEAFHHPPSPKIVLQCIVKQQLLWERLELDTARETRKATWKTRNDLSENHDKASDHTEVVTSTESIQSPAVPLPPLWIVAGGVPKTALADLAFEPCEGWPNGFYVAPRGFRLYIVATNELPEELDTLVLRLMGKGKVRTRAIAQLQALRHTSVVWDELARIVGELVLSFQKKTKSPNPEEEAFIMEAMRLIDKMIEEGKKIGVAEGKKIGVAEERVQLLHQLIELRLERPLTASEASCFQTHVQTEPKASLLETIHRLDRTALEAWLTSLPSSL